MIIELSELFSLWLLYLKPRAFIPEAVYFTPELLSDASLPHGEMALQKQCSL